MFGSKPGGNQGFDYGYADRRAQRTEESWRQEKHPLVILKECGTCGTMVDREALHNGSCRECVGPQRLEITHDR